MIELRDKLTTFVNYGMGDVRIITTDDGYSVLTVPYTVDFYRTDKELGDEGSINLVKDPTKAVRIPKIQLMVGLR